MIDLYEKCNKKNTNCIKFIKMSGLGNDYIYIDNRKMDHINYSDLSIKVSDRRFGIGSDGLVVLEKDLNNDCLMRIFNNDGSEATLCGNALRCVGYLLFLESGKSKYSINTLSGAKLTSIDYNSKDITVEMIDYNDIKFSKYKDDERVVNVGNPHLIMETKELNNEIVTKFYEESSLLQKSKDFPESINIELIQIVSPRELNMYVNERGSGRTLACGSGATAVFCFCLKKGLTETRVKINLEGGKLDLYLENNKIYMKGGVEIICQGNYYWSDNE